MAKLISLSFEPSNELPDIADLKAFLGTDFGRQVPGFTVLDVDASWSDCRLDIVGKDADGALVVVFPSVSRLDRDLRDIITNAMLAAGWLEENRDEAVARYAPKGVDVDRPLRMILVAPSVAKPSRTLLRTLQRAGVETMPYSIFDIHTSDGPLRAVSFDASSAPPGAAAPRESSSRESASPKAAPRSEARAEAASEPAEPHAPKGDSKRERAPEPKAESAASATRAASPVEAFVSGLSDANLRTMSEHVLRFLLQRFPTASGVVNGQTGFTLNVGLEHLATVKLDRTAVWLEVGPERIPTNKIKDPTTLDRAMSLPSVLEALDSVQQH